MQYFGYLAAAGLFGLIALAVIGGDDTAPTGPAYAPAPRVAAAYITPAAGAAHVVVGPGEAYASILDGVRAAGGGGVVEVRAGVYHEAVRIVREVTVRPYGDGPVWIDGSCEEDTGIRVVSGSSVTLAGIAIRNTRGPAILIGDSPEGVTPPDNITIDGMTMEDFNCADDDGQFNAGVAVWHAHCCMQITNNTITYRTSGEVRGRGNGIWFKTTDAAPSGGQHVIAGNTITGGWDGIGGEAEGEIHGSFDRDTVIEDNVIKDCWDDGIQAEGGNVNISIIDNDISGCGTGIAAAPTLIGPLEIEGNAIHDLVVGLYDNQFCFKVGGEGESVGEVRLTDNTCVSDGDGIMQTNAGLPKITSRGNCFSVSRYVIQVGDRTPRGSSFDGDILWTSDPERFVEWEGEEYDSLEAFQETGQERGGKQANNCS